jgi:hypothetical protein
VINGRGYSTKCGGCIPDAEVLDAMREAPQNFYPIEDVREARRRD